MKRIFSRLGPFPEHLFSILVVGVGCLVACEAPSGGPAEEATEASPAAPPVEWALAIHGGAGVTRAGVAAETEPAYEKSLQGALEEGKKILQGDGTSLDAVEAVVRLLEDDPLFNAGRGAVFTNAGTNELDAAVMDGESLSCGAVSGLKTVKNPITLARHVMERSRHVFLVGDGAERFADEMAVDRVPADYFFVQRRHDRWRQVLEAEEEKTASSAAPPALPTGQGRYGTVGAVALDRHGNLAAATSTGGMTNKRFGRVGDVPVIGAGTYANNATCAVSCTGIGEQFIRHTVASDVSARMEHGGRSLSEAAGEVIGEVLNPGDGGLIAVGKDGSISIEFNTEGMFHGSADSSGRFQVGIWAHGD
ncbi:MAG: isoaspartyl peptidase/L-asparaginase [Deltaproteobacteria bacterium]|nr:isoaspartyl peptidase/L-asparaginase [Deltaproteobacteria bacterium]